MDLSPESFRNGYLALFDDRTRDAHLAALIDARCNEPSKWPTVAIVRKIARLFEVPAAELGAFFGLLCQPGAKGEVWVDIIRSPDTAELVAVEGLSRGQLRALGMMRSLVA
ncbi:MAG: hypothetical protein B7X90_08690 [Novosphingobium sp. 17-62-19]|uniref:hypothetical protein n=1 Tax=Novosphingobium sp. 17-62-19 TaxID=1970406 RepID=UPI000BD04A1D|nr:hypothetical protein [Novosphingobium sp. 17-62-19]OYX96776.1 MAG: hypothetical protein B7Y74_00135 [Novosphingobium sp. 35-62-5]OZA19470.1 MAG: hypothetical protein B7X90_08690 [Novosphingobium sp. 17-62-19]